MNHPRSVITITVLTALVLFLFVTPATLAADHYVRAAATGNGSGTDWVNACADFAGSCAPAALVRGDTYYVAAGSYMALTLDTAASGTLGITIKRATVADHGTGVGWNNSYGDGQAAWPSVTFGSSYWTLDGVTGSGTSGYGIKVQQTNCTSASKDITFGANVSYITLAHLELPHCGTGPAYDSYNQDVLYAALGSDHVTVRYCYLHHVSRTFILTLSATNWLVEHSNFYRRDGTDPSVHGEAMSINSSGSNAGWVIRYNTFKDVYGTGFVVIKDSVQAGFSIYGNTFTHSGSSWMVSNGAITNTSGDTNSNMLVYNNTFVNVNGNAGVNWYSGTGNQTYDNLWYGGTLTFANAGDDDNWFYPSGGSGGDYGEAHGQVGSGNPFLDLAGENFRLSVATTAGISLSGTLPSGCTFGTNCYNVDADGLDRGADGTWDRGAYEFNQGGSTVPPPTGLAAVVQ